MSETKWTKGPWNPAADGEGVLTGYVDSTERRPIYRICDTRLQWQNREERNANAHLIAAAPELYEALAMLLDAFEGDSDYLFTQGRKLGAVALAKARGEQ